MTVGARCTDLNTAQSHAGVLAEARQKEKEQVGALWCTPTTFTASQCVGHCFVCGQDDLQHGVDQLLARAACMAPTVFGPCPRVASRVGGADGVVRLEASSRESGAGLRARISAQAEDGRSAGLVGLSAGSCQSRRKRQVLAFLSSGRHSRAGGKGHLGCFS